MAIPSRRADPGHVIAGARTFFVTSSICGKRYLLQSDRSAALFVGVLCHYRDLRRFRLHEFVVMPDHFRTLLTVESDMTSSPPCNSSREVSLSARGGNSGSRLRSGKKVSRKRGFLTPTHSSEPFLFRDLPARLKPCPDTRRSPFRCSRALTTSSYLRRIQALA